VESTGITNASGRDYGTGLVLFGLLDLLIGIVFLAKAVLFALLSIPGVTPPIAARFGSELPLTALLAFIPAAFFLALGFGSIAARRWARALALALSLAWLALAALCLAFGLFWIPRIVAALRPAMDEAARAGHRAAGSSTGVGVVVVMAAFLLPAASAIFYGNSGVERECARRDPQSRWTDRVPIGVLVLIVVLGIAALLAFQIGFSTTRQRVYFGHPLEAGPRAAWAGLAIAEIAAAWGLSRMRRWAWFAALAVLIARGVASIAVTRRFASVPDAAFLLAPARRTPESEAFLAALRPLHIFDAVTLFFGAIAAGTILLLIAVARPFFAGSGAAGD
jgi:hypothetical protein